VISQARKEVEGIGDGIRTLEERAREAALGIKEGFKESLSKPSIEAPVIRATSNFHMIGEMAGRALVDGIIRGTLNMENLLKSILSAFLMRALGLSGGGGFLGGLLNTSGVGAGPGVSVNSIAPAASIVGQPSVVNMPALPEPVTPEAQAVNAYWLQVWTATSRAARARGFKD
jgi:hypothetical protein